MFAGSDRGADRAAVMNTLIMTARLNDVDPKAWLADIFARLASIPLTASTKCSHGNGSGEPKHLLPHKLPDPPGIIAV